MNLLFLTIVFPLLGFMLLICMKKSCSEYFISCMGVGSIGLSTLITVFIAIDFFNYVYINNNIGVFSFTQPIFTWISVFSFCVPVVFKLDILSLSMLLVITGIGLLIHIYAIWYMQGDVCFARFFAYSNLFIASMIVLVLSDNLLIMYFGWEAVGLCSYLLIGFYCSDSKNGIAALKSFITTRVGDLFLMCALFMIYYCFHTLNFHELTLISSEEYFKISPTWIALFLLFGALAKSAQLPFQSWLLDAMVAPAPVSALVHSATMVTAGVYLILRTYNFFVMTPDILYCIGIIASATLIISSCSAIVQTDIKKILAYSTISQIGYMFLALSVQSWGSAVFHLVVHACFKALLFLASGSLVSYCCNEQNILKMGGLFKSIPLIYLSFIVGSLSLSAFPIISAGFYSKGDIFWSLWNTGNYLFLIIGLLGSLLTVIYTFRMVFYIFHGIKRFHLVKFNYCSSFVHYFPLLILIILSSGISLCIRFPLLNIVSYKNIQCSDKLFFEFFMSIFVIFSFLCSWIYYIFSCRCIVVNKYLNTKIRKYIFDLLISGWGFDFLYKQIFIKPYLFLSNLVSHDPVNTVINIIVILVDSLSNKLILSENGQLRWYIETMFFGVLITVLIYFICRYGTFII